MSNETENNLPEINQENEDTSIPEINGDENETPIISDEVSDNESQEEVAIPRKPTGIQVDQLYFDDNELASDENISLPSVDRDKLKEIISSIPNIDLTDSEEVRKWLEILDGSTDKETFKNVFVEALKDPNRDFRQSVEFNGKKLAGAKPRVKQDTNQIYKGNRALVGLMSYLRKGIHFQAPLWNTGIWITFTAPTETEILDLYRQIISDTIEFGRYTFGLALSNPVSYTVDRLIDFALLHMHSSTLKLDEDSDLTLKDIIVAQDIPSLLWGMACAMYPNGFKFSRACVDNPEKCNYVYNGNLNVSALQFTDTLMLTDAQKAHMSDRQPNCKNLEAIKRYQEDHSKSINKTITVLSDSKKPINFTLKSPTLTEYVSSGYKWVESMVQLVENSVVIPKDDKEKNLYIKENSKSTAMRQYTHWVKEIEFDNNTINDIETIENTLNYLSSDSILSDSFIKEVIKYIETSSISVIGIPNYTCPVCQKSQYESELNTPIYKEIIPLDPIVVFTDLIEERTRIISQR